MNLFRAELHRFARRRLSLLFGVLAVGGLLFVTLVMWFNSSTGPSEADLAQAQREADEESRQYEQCVADERYLEANGYGPVAEDPLYEDMTREQLCEQFFWADAQAEDFIYVYTFQFDQEGLMLVAGVGIVTGLLVMLLAASAIGAEWSSGGMANLLVWHPARMRVWGAKLSAAAVTCAAAVVVMLVLAFALLYMTAAARGDVGTLDSSWWEGALAKLARTLVLTIAMTVSGSSLAMLGRHTAIAGGVIAGYLVIGDLLVRLTGIALRFEFPERFSLYTWVSAWIQGKLTLHDWSTPVERTMTITATDAGLLLGGIVVVIGALASVAFAKRDAT